MSVAADQLIEQAGTCRTPGLVAASTILYSGTLVFVNASGYLDDDTGSGANKFAGIAPTKFDNSGGSNGDVAAEVINQGIFKLVGASLAQTSVGKPIYASDNYTLTLTPTSSTVLVGIVREYLSSTTAMVELVTDAAALVIPAAGANGPSFTTVGLLPIAAQQAISGPGAVNVTTFCTKVTTTGADAFTLADGVVVGQLKKIQLIVDGGDATLTPSNLAGGTTITFADAGDFAVLSWDGVDWRAIELGNDADGATAPVLA